MAIHHLLNVTKNLMGHNGCAHFPSYVAASLSFTMNYIAAIAKPIVWEIVFNESKKRIIP